MSPNLRIIPHLAEISTMVLREDYYTSLGTEHGGYIEHCICLCFCTWQFYYLSKTKHCTEQTAADDCLEWL